MYPGTSCDGLSAFIYVSASELSRHEFGRMQLNALEAVRHTLYRMRHRPRPISAFKNRLPYDPNDSITIRELPVPCLKELAALFPAHSSRLPSLDLPDIQLASLCEISAQSCAEIHHVQVSFHTIKFRVDHGLCIQFDTCRSGRKRRLHPYLFVFSHNLCNIKNAEMEVCRLRN
jgi:hypothetical protein